MTKQELMDILRDVDIESIRKAIGSRYETKVDLEGLIAKQIFRFGKLKAEVFIDNGIVTCITLSKDGGVVVYGEYDD